MNLTNASTLAELSDAALDALCTKAINGLDAAHAFAKFSGDETAVEAAIAVANLFRRERFRRECVAAAQVTL